MPEEITPIEEIKIEEPKEETKIITRLVGDKTYTIRDVPTEAREQKRIEIVETVTRNEAKFRGTLNDINSEITMLEREIVQTQQRLDDKLALRAEIEAQLDTK